LKREFAANLRCLSCVGSDWNVEAAREDEREIREGRLRCARCGSEHAIGGGVVDFLDPKNEGLQREIQGWIELAGPLPEYLATQMTALPYYPKGSWTHVAPDFFQLFEHFDFAGKRVVDIGAGRSWSSRHLASLGRASQVVAIDVLTNRFLGLETADLFFHDDGSFFERIRGDVHRMPLRDGWADAVFSCATLHHSSDLVALFREVWRVLRPGGQLLFVAEPSKKASIPDRRPQNAEAEHGINENLYSLAEYSHALRTVGFRFRRLVPRSIRYRLVYPDPDFQGEIPKALERLTRSERGRNFLERLLSSRLLGPILYRYWSLPLTGVASKPASDLVENRPAEN
jgi:ubiquinone/menaquinone biosynthesis C-methylase UbiE